MDGQPKLFCIAETCQCDINKLVLKYPINKYIQSQFNNIQYLLNKKKTQS